MDHVKQF